MKVLCLPDTHGKHEIILSYIEKFENGDYDKLICLGDLTDSWDRTNEDILRCWKLMLDCKETHGDKVELLLGNHEVSYMFIGQQCSGYRPDLAVTLNPLLIANRKLLKIAYQYGNNLFTHAGVQRHWLNKHQEYIDKLADKYDWPKDELGTTLNNLLEVKEGVDMLCEVGVKRGGIRGDYGGPIWCDRVEMESYGPIKGYNQVVGHTPQKYLDKIVRFEGGKHYNNTSVTFCDILDKTDQILEFELKD